ncbi:MAG: hypothetical protein WC813_00655 [Patescibacteria group bacterium]|jgi:hypothetical protein
MTLTTHVAIGAGIGVLAGEPALGFVLGAISHFLVDMIPHGDTGLADRYYNNHEKLAPVAYATIDGALSIVLLMVFVAVKPDSIANTPFAAAVIGSVLPDLMVGVADVMKKNRILKSYRQFHFYFHDYFSRSYGDVKLRYALVAQAVFVLLVVKLIEQIA